MDLPSLQKSLDPARSDREDSSSTTDATSSESLATMMRNFQFPVPPIRDIPQIPALERKDVRQLPRNNSWAAESPPNNQALQKVLDASSIEAYVDRSGVNGGLALLHSPTNTKPPFKSLLPLHVDPLNPVRLEEMKLLKVANLPRDNENVHRPIDQIQTRKISGPTLQSTMAER